MGVRASNLRDTLQVSQSLPVTVSMRKQLALNVGGESLGTLRDRQCHAVCPETLLPHSARPRVDPARLSGRAERAHSFTFVPRGACAIWLPLHSYACIYMYIHIRIHIHIYVCNICLCTYMYIHTYLHMHTYDTYTRTTYRHVRMLPKYIHT